MTFAAYIRLDTYPSPTHFSRSFTALGPIEARRRAERSLDELIGTSYTLESIAPNELNDHRNLEPRFMMARKVREIFKGIEA